MTIFLVFAGPAKLGLNIKINLPASISSMDGARKAIESPTFGPCGLFYRFKLVNAGECILQTSLYPPYTICFLKEQHCLTEARIFKFLVSTYHCYQHYSVFYIQRIPGVLKTERDTNHLLEESFIPTF